MINLLLQNNIYLFVLCSPEINAKPVGALNVEWPDNQFISLQNGLD